MQKSNLTAQYTQIKYVDKYKFIECISGIEYIASGKSLIVSMDQSGKPKLCINKIYTYSQTQSKENESMSFIKID